MSINMRRAALFEAARFGCLEPCLRPVFGMQIGRRSQADTSPNRAMPAVRRESRFLGGGWTETVVFWCSTSGTGAGRYVRNGLLWSAIALGLATTVSGFSSPAFAAAAAADGPRLEAPVVIRGLTIIPSPGEKLEGATIVLDQGRIVGVGKDAAIPAAARELDGTGLVAYAGFIDALCRAGLEPQERTAAAERRVEGDWPIESDGPQAATVEAGRAGIYPSRRAEQLADIDAGTIDKPGTFDKQRQAGFTAALLAGPREILGGTAAVIELGDRPLRHSVVRPAVAHMASFEPPGKRAISARGRYPSATFGVVAQFRQVMADAAWYRDMGVYVGKHPEARGQRPYDPELEAALDIVSARLPVVWEANHVDEIHRALNLAEEFRFKPVIAGGREAWKAIERLKAGGVSVVVSLELPAKVKEYKLDPAALRKTGDDDSLYGKEWEKRPYQPKSAYDIEQKQRDEVVANAGKLEQAGLAWCFSAVEMKDPADALENLRAMIEAGLSAEAALRALTVSPAKLLGVEDELGTIRIGMRGNLTIMTGPLAEKKTKIKWVFVDGRQFEIAPAGEGKRKDSDKDDAEDEDESAGSEGGRKRGRGGKSSSGEVADAGGGSAASTRPANPPVAGGNAASAPATTSAAAPGPYDHLLAHEPAWPTESDAERDPGVRTGGSVLLKNALVLTVSGEDLPGTSVLVQNGKITQIGRDVKAPQGVTTIDLTGYCLMPGIIDPHSHIALDSVNEGSLSVTPEVRCEDVVRHDDPEIFRAVAGGCTTIHAMHGSANTIGGQNVSLKLKYGRPASEMIIRDRPRTVKFALGENVKRPGMTPRGEQREPREVRRFPGTRMGVETTMRRAFSEARRYGEEIAAFQAASRGGGDARPVRRDLRLDALLDILNGDIWVHCHCYRADEILRLLDVAEDFGFRIAVLQHVLEGYRVMPEALRHGCAASTFSDWWAYKVEAYHAIPHNAGMMLKHGICATVNSDSGDLIRHLNFEAAKCLKYSGLTPNETLRLCTLNGAVQLGLDKRIGSIEVGKDGDIAVYDGHPLDSFSRCVLTLIEGEVYFRHRDFNASAPPPPTRPALDSPVVALRPAAAPPRAGNPAAGSGVRGADSRANESKQPVSGSNGSNGSNGHSADGAHPSIAEAGSSSANGRERPSSGVPRPARGPDATFAPARGPDATFASDCYAIVGGTLHPVSRAPIERGTLIIRDGKIAEIGVDLTVPPGATLIDAAGKHVYPGLINAGSALGLNEINSVDVSIDTSETGTCQPDVLSLSAFDPFSAMVDVTRAEGITTALILPSGPAIAGQAGLLDLAGWSASEMAVERRAALVVSLPSKPAESLADRERRNRRVRRGREASEEPDDLAGKQLKELERFFRDARLFAVAARDAKARGAKPPLVGDPRFEAMIPYALGERPVIFNADDYKAILEAALFARQLELKPIIFGGRDAWKAADVLAREQIPVIYDGVFNVPRGADCWDANYRAAGVMARAGVKFCTATRDSSLAKLLPVEIGFAVAHGLSADDALRTITLSAAEILGIADRVGSLDVGKVANVVIGSDHPCQVTNSITHVFVRGRPQPLDTTHTRQRDQWEARPAPALPPARTDLKGPPAFRAVRS